VYESLQSRFRVNITFIGFRNVYDVRGAVDSSDCLSDVVWDGVVQKFRVCVVLLYADVCVGL
jgi:hypothetical protein